MITGGTLPTYPQFTVTNRIVDGQVDSLVIDHGDGTEVQKVILSAVEFDSDLSFSVSASTGEIIGNRVTGGGTVVSQLTSVFGQTKNIVSAIPNQRTESEFTIRPGNLAEATRSNYQASGNLDPFDRQNNLLPSVDLTCIGKVRCIAITPREIAQAWHVRGNLGRIVTFVDIEGVEHQRTIVETSQRLGSDLVIQRLDTDLPNTITPAKVFPSDVENYFSIFTRNLTLGFVAYKSNRLSAGSFFFANGFFDLQNSGEPSWREGVDGDSGSSMFVVIEGQVVAQGGVFNEAEQCTAIHKHLDAVQSFCSQPLSILDLSEYPRVN